MRRYYIVSGILLILPIIEFAVAAPTLVQEKSQAGVDAVHIPEDAVTMLRKRGNELDELWLKFLNRFENHFAPESSPPSSGWTDVKQPLPSIPEEPSPMSSPDHAPPSPGSLTESGYESMKGDAPPGSSSPASSTMSSDSSPVFPTWFHPTDHGLMGAHAPQPNLGPSNPGPLTEFDSDHRFVVEEPPSRPTSPTKSDADHEYQVVHPPPSPTTSDYETVKVPHSSS